MRSKGWINLYRSGYFHRCGKPAVCERHAGDVYLDEAAARRDIDPPELYVATVPIEWDDPDDCVRANAEDSTPVPLRETRKAVEACRADGGDCAAAISTVMGLAIKIKRLGGTP